MITPLFCNTCWVIYLLLFYILSIILDKLCMSPSLLVSILSSSPFIFIMTFYFKPSKFHKKFFKLSRIVTCGATSVKVWCWDVISQEKLITADYIGTVRQAKDMEHSNVHIILNVFVKIEYYKKTISQHLIVFCWKM